MDTSYLTNSQFKTRLEKEFGKKISVWIRREDACHYEGAASVGTANDQGYFYGYAESRALAYRKVLNNLLSSLQRNLT